MIKKLRIKYLREIVATASIIFALNSTSSIVAQNKMPNNNSTASPYSIYGLGDPQSPALNMGRAMGGLGTSLRMKNIINPMNPASYNAVDSLTFLMDFSISAGAVTFREYEKKQTTGLGNFDYACILFPIMKGYAVSLGIKPFSITGYNYASKESLNKNRTYESIYTGTGGVNDLYLGASAKVYKGLSVGVNGHFYFGNTTHNATVEYSSEKAVIPFTSTQFKVKQFSYDLGLQYEQSIGQIKKHPTSLVFGLTFAPKVHLNTTKTEFKREQMGKKGQQESLKTEKQHGIYNLPMSFSTGISFVQNNHFTSGLDFTYSLWGKLNYPEKDIYHYQNQWKAVWGANYIPDSESSKYFKTIEYRAGVSAQNSYYQFYHANKFIGLNTYSATFGIGLPLSDRRSIMNISLSYSQTMPSISGLLRDHTFRLSVGLTFNESWFKKLRIN